MDLVGICMCLVTLPMAALTVLSLAGGIGLFVSGDWAVVVVGLAATMVCLALATILERLTVATDEAAIQTANAGNRPAARLIAIVSGSVPVIVIFAWEFASFRFLVPDERGAPAVLLWLWSYGVATGPWTIFALRVSRFRRTLCGIRAYAGHLAYWLLSGLVLAFGIHPSFAVPAMVLPAILPFVVGMMLALADRDALTNVRV